jgi:hypothetical protein
MNRRHQADWEKDGNGRHQQSATNQGEQDTQPFLGVFHERYFERLKVNSE